METYWGIIIAALALLVTFVQMLHQRFTVNVRIYERLTSLETKTDLFWKAVEQNVLGLLKSYPTNIDKDILIDKMLHNQLTLDEANALRTIFKGELEKQIDKGSKLLYILALGRLEQIIFDKTERS